MKRKRYPKNPPAFVVFADNKGRTVRFHPRTTIPQLLAAGWTFAGLSKPETSVPDGIFTHPAPVTK